MAKISGLGAQVTVADAGATPRDISNDLVDFAIATPVALQNITGVDKSAIERLALLRDYTLQLSGVFNSAANLSHAVLSTVTTTATARATAVFPTTNHSTPTLSANLIYDSYDVTRSNSGELTWKSKGNLADGAVPTWA